MPPTGAVKELVDLLNRALERENAAHLQYLSHAELVQGLNAEPIMERLREIAGDEAEHQKKLRTLIADFLGGVPSMGIDATHGAKTVREILRVNLKQEREAVELYTGIHKKVVQAKENLPYCYITLEHEVRHIIISEQEHIVELSRLLDKK